MSISYPHGAQPFTPPYSRTPTPQSSYLNVFTYQLSQDESALGAAAEEEHKEIQSPYFNQSPTPPSSSRALNASLLSADIECPPSPRPFSHSVSMSAHQRSESTAPSAQHTACAHWTKVILIGGSMCVFISTLLHVGHLIAEHGTTPPTHTMRDYWIVSGLIGFAASGMAHVTLRKLGL